MVLVSVAAVQDSCTVVPLLLARVNVGVDKAGLEKVFTVLPVE